MCGIAGFKEDASIDNPDALISRMLSHLQRRGPDGRGHTVLDCPGGRWHLGHRRLSIIDPEGGAQPMTNQKKTVAVTCNGEIYNFKSLREQLRTQGHVFRTRSDTEVLIHGYEQWGMENLLSRLQGMFAFALVDTTNDRIFLARDPMGQKPLYYSFSSEHGLVFASSLRSILETSWVSREISRKALHLGIALRHIPAPFSAYKKIRKLSPGHYLLLQGKNPAVKRYWEYFPPEQEEDCRLRENTRKVFEHLLECVSDCLVSDVPVCLMLSSGLDSSLVAGAIAELGKAKEIPAITVAFKEKTYDESREAGLLARQLGFQHETVLLGEDKLESSINTTMDIQEEPFADPSLLPAVVLSETIRKTAKVSLGGDGGDEIFGGYPTFTAIRLHRILSKIPVKGIDILRRLLPVNHKRYSSRYKIERFIRGHGLPQEKAFIAWLLTAADEEIAGLLGNHGKDFNSRLIYSLARDIKEKDAVRLMSLQYLKMFLPGVLNKVDWASMHHGLEVRAPFLQPPMVKLALDLPGNAKVRNRKTKYVLRKLAREIGLVRHSRIPKRGFNVPLSRWITGRLRPFSEQYLNSNALKKTGFFDAEAVLGLWREHLAGKANNFDLLWGIISTQKFLRDHAG